MFIGDVDSIRRVNGTIVYIASCVSLSSMQVINKYTFVDLVLTLPSHDA